MQFFPVSTSASDAAYADASGSNHASGSADGAFGTIFSSFIEDERYDYSGRPSGFAGYGAQSGTLSDETGSEVAKELRKRDVDEQSVSRLEALMASGSPLTIGTIFNALSGRSRLTEGLEGEERDSFKMLLGKLGFSKDEQDELLGLSDDGKASALWKRLSDKLGQLDGETDVTGKEWNALLKGLDLSAETRKGLLALFGDAEERSLNGESMRSMLASIEKEYLLREQANMHTQSQMRSAVEDVLKRARAREQAAPVEDAKGSRRSEQSEALMDNSVRKNTGVDQVKQDALGDEEEHFENRKDGKSRSERILAAEPDIARPKGKGEAASGESATARLFQNVAVSAGPQQQPLAQPQANTLENLARNFRQEIFSQVEQGILHNAANGSQRLALHLNPAELGQITVILSVHQGEVRATIRAEQQESAGVLREQLAELKASLEQQGLKVKELDVQTGLQDGAFSGQWDGHDKHNLMRDANERDRMLRLARIRRDEHSSASGKETMTARQQTASGGGLHVVA